MDLQQVIGITRLECSLWFNILYRWLNFRMQVLGAIISGTVGMAVILSVDSISSTIAGIVLLYSLSFCDYATFLARGHADCQMEMNCVERIREYSQIVSEKYDNEEGQIQFIPQSVASNLGPQSTCWPNDGEIEFRNLSLKYKSSSSPVLRGVSFVIPAKARCGVVGRTAAGKSSLITALFRLVEPFKGEIFLDKVDILKLPLHSVRNNIAIVPQEPTLFTGSVRWNLDPFHEHPDEMLWGALRHVHLAEYIRSLDFSLGGNNSNSFPSLDNIFVSEKGANFSSGQRQLMCLARALLRNASVLVLDECTANVDYKTDLLIQETVRSSLINSTVLCIAHRLNTIAFYDKVIVMKEGEMTEFGEPYALMMTRGSIFRSMCEDSGDFDELFKTAQLAHEERQMQIKSPILE